MSKFKVEQLVMMTDGYLKGDIYKVDAIEMDGDKRIYRLSAQTKGMPDVYRHDYEIKSHNPARNMTMIQLANETPAPHSFGTLMYLIDNGELEGIPDPLAI